MKKLIMSAIMCIAFVASSSVMAQDTTPKKECCKAQTECTKGSKDKKASTKDKKECTKDSKKACCSKDKKADKK